MDYIDIKWISEQLESVNKRLESLESKLKLERDIRAMDRWRGLGGDPRDFRK